MSLKTKLTFYACALPVFALIYGIFSLQTKIILNSLLVIACVFGLLLSDKKLRIFSVKTFAFILIFMLLSLFAGRFGAYEKIKYWDKALHFLSGFILIMTGKEIYLKLKGAAANKKLLKAFAFFIALSGAAFWEIFEFFSDLIFKTQAQNNSLSDTMLDIIAGTLSALIAVIFL